MEEEELSRLYRKLGMLAMKEREIRRQMQEICEKIEGWKWKEAEDE